MSKTKSSVKNQASARQEKAFKGFSLKERLVSGEQVLVTAEISAGIYWKALAVFVFAVVVAVGLAVELGAVLGFAAVGLAIYAILLKEILLLVVTNKRIFARYGILQVDVVDIHFDKIESLELGRMLPGYLMGYANVMVMGTGGRVIVIPYVSNGPELRRAYNELVLGEGAAAVVQTDTAAEGI